MLSAFTARPIVELKVRDKSKIESILAYGDRLLVGLSTGSLRIYRVNEIPPPNNNASLNNVDSISQSRESSEEPSQPPEQKIAELLREQEKFSRYKIEQLAIIKEANILISLSGGLVSIHDLQSYELQEQLTRTKGASTFAVNSYIVKDASTGVPSIVSRLAVAVKRRLLVWAWHDMELAEETTEIALASSIKTLTWATGTKIVTGLSASYVVVDVGNEAVTPIVGPGSIGGTPGQESSRLGGVGVGALSYVGMGITEPKPLATGLGEGEMLLAKDVNTHFVDRNGEPLGRRQIPWRVAPEAVGYSYPYLLALQETSKGVLEVRNPETLNLLQSITLPGASVLQVAQPNISLAHAGKGFLVASERIIWRMGAQDYDSQIDALVEVGQLDEAVSLLGMLEDTLIRDKQGRVREIKMQKAQKLFDSKKFRDSLDLFAEVSAPPERVIKLYPKLIAGDLAQDESGMDVTEHDKPPASPSETEAPKGHKMTVSAVGNIDDNPGTPKKFALGKKHKKTESGVNILSGSKPPEAPAVATIKNVKSDEMSETSSVGDGAEASQIDGGLSDKELKTAVRELQAFLADIRRRLQVFFDQDQNVKATSELQTINSNNGGEVVKILENLFGISSLQDIDDQNLIDTAKLVDTTLFRAYMYAAPTMAGSLFRIINFCDPGVVMEKLEETGRYNDLIDFLFGKRLHRSALERLRKFGQTEEDKEGDDEMTNNQLRGPSRTVRYLQHLPPELIDLILEFAKWPIQTKPEMGMEIFLADTENAESLPRTKVLGFLESVDKALALRYLEHVVDELNDTTPELHQRIIALYFEQLKEPPTESGDAARQELQAKFLTMLRTSALYSPAKVLGMLPSNEPAFYEARAIVFNKMGQHKQALEIYVFKLKDPAKAEEYCNHVHLTEDTLGMNKNSKSTASRRKSTVDPIDEKPSIYNTLLNMYLNPPKSENTKPMWGPAIEILARHGPRLPAIETLDLIPESLPVKELEFYFRGRIREANSVVSETRVVTGLRNVESIRMQAGLLLGEGVPGGNGGRKRKVKIDEQRICGVCYKRLGASVISVFPDNSVVHLGCANRRQAEMGKP